MSSGDNGLGPDGPRIRVTLSDGSAELRRPFTPRDHVFVRDAVEVGDWYERVEALVVSHSYDVGFLDWPMARARRLVQEWQRASLEEALPPASAESSPEPSAV